MRYFYNKDIKGICCEPACVEECLDMIIDLGLDYDGCNGSVKSMCALVDELVSYAKDAVEFLDKDKILIDPDEDEASLQVAMCIQQQSEE